MAIALALAILVATLLAPPDAAARPHHPDTISSVTKQLNQLADRADALTERYNATKLQVQHERQALAAARRAQSRASAAYRVARARFIAFLQAQYEAGGFGSVGALLSSSDPTAYLDSVSSEQLVAQRRADIVADMAAAHASAERAQAAADRLLAQARQTSAALSDKRRSVAEQTLKYETVLSALTLPQQQAYFGYDTPSAAQIRAAVDTPAPDPAAAKAVKFAIDQVGKPYVWAASGPNAYDCSGLTMAAWAHAGVTLPHYSAAQYTYGTHVGYDQLEPGDLIFLYSDLHHVEIYVGAGVAISAPQPGEDVKFVLVAYDRAVFAGATRLG